MENQICTKKDILTQTSKKITDIFTKSIGSPHININEVFEYIELINEWCKVLKDYDASPVLQETSYSILSSIHIAFSGFYREAYLSLRSALESACYFIYFVDNNYSYLKWKENIIDVNWSNLKDEEEGILSHRYLHIFSSTIKTEKLLTEINRVYRICSEYVHGKYDFMFINKFCKVDFNLESLQEFLEIYLNISRIINILLAIRFKNMVRYINGDFFDIIKNEYIRYGIQFEEE